MTPRQHQTKKFAVYINWNSIITAVCTGAIMWMGAGIKGMYNDLKRQPFVDEKQNASISALAAEVGKLKEDNERVKNEQTRMGGKLIYLEAIIPDKNQFVIKGAPNKSN